MRLFRSMMNCNKCNAELTPVFPDTNRRYTDMPLYNEALVIVLQGGYGAFFDDSPQKLIICDECAHEFFDKNPWAITPELDFLLPEQEDEEFT